MKGKRVIMLFLLLAAGLSGACSLLTFGAAPAAAAPINGQTATALVQTIQVLSTQNAFLQPTATPAITNTPQPTLTSTATVTPTATQTLTNTPTTVPTSTPTRTRAYVNGYAYGYPYGYPNFGNPYYRNPYPPYRLPPNRRPPFYPISNQTCDRAGFAGDVSISDGSVLGAGDAFTKTWAVTNTGSCSWNTNYKLIFTSGSQLSAPSSVNLPNSVGVGQTVDISVNMTAPGSAGTYTGYWMLESDNGTVFGVGIYGNTAVYVNIVVE